MHAIHGNPEDANGMEVNTHGGFQQGASKGSKEGGKGKTDYFNLVKGGRASLQKGDGKKEDGKQTGKFKHQYYYHQQYQSQEEPRKAFSSKSRSRLIPTQWSAPVVDSKFLDRKGGVAIVKEHEVYEVVERVGTTLRPTAVVTSRPFHAMGHRGFASTPVSCSLMVFDETMPTEEGRGAWKLICGSRKFLTQLGDGQPVRREVEPGMVEVAEVRAMIRLWLWDEADTQVTGTIVMDVMRAAANTEFDANDINIRTDGSVAVRVPTSQVDTLLSKSGNCGAFFKPASEEKHALMEHVFLLGIHSTK